MKITEYKKVFIGLAIFLVIASFVSIAHFGLKEGIDFTGGTVVDLSFSSGTPTMFLSSTELLSAGIKAYETGNGNVRLATTKSYDEVTRVAVPLLASSTYKETGVSMVGPTLGKEMKKKAVIGIIVAILAILAFIAFSFRGVSHPVSSWKYGFMAILTLAHDIIIPTGVFAYLSAHYGAQVDTLFIVALLTILGVSISDKIVVFDRIRENLHRDGKKPFADIVDASLRQTFARSFNTSLVVVLSLLVLFLYGPAATKYFSLTLMIGMVVGTYSSIFVASPLLTYFVKKSK